MAGTAAEESAAGTGVAAGTAGTAEDGSAVRTVLGDIAPADLGVCDAHDHLFFASRQLPGQELDDPAAATAELSAFAGLGGRAVAQWTPFGLNRRVADLAKASRDSGVHVIAATGVHQLAHYPPGRLDPVAGRLAALFISELRDGTRDGPDGLDGPPGPRAGMIKTAGAFHGLDGHARAVLTAAAEAHHATGAPIGVHHELGTAALDVVDVLCGRLGVSPDRVILGHLNRNPDLPLQLEIAATGAFLAFDGPSRANHATDWRLFGSLAALAGHGHTGQVLVGGDTTTAAARASTGGGPGLPWLLRVLRPRLERDLGPDVAAQVFVANPARAFAARWT